MNYKHKLTPLRAHRDKLMKESQIFSFDHQY